MDTRTAMKKVLVICERCAKERVQTAWPGKPYPRFCSQACAASAQGTINRRRRADYAPREGGQG